MKEGSSYYPYYGYAYQRSDLQPKNPPSWLAGFQSISDWLNKQPEPEYLPELAEADTLKESIRV
jgi:tyrosine-protein kinase Etk/Wzc